MKQIGEWEVFLAITVIVSFVIVIFKASRFFNSLEGATNNLNESVKQLRDEIKALGEKNHDSHKKIWEHNDEQDDILADHETRITLIENLKKEV